jgi:hypothetical protein
MICGKVVFDVVLAAIFGLAFHLWAERRLERRIWDLERKLAPASPWQDEHGVPIPDPWLGQGRSATGTA